MNIVKTIDNVLNKTIKHYNNLTGLELKAFYVPTVEGGATGKLYIKDIDENYVYMSTLGNFPEDILGGDNLDTKIAQANLSAELLNAINSIHTRQNKEVVTSEELINTFRAMEKANEYSYTTFKKSEVFLGMEKKYSHLINNILNGIKFPARSNKQGFYDTTKLDVIKKNLDKYKGYKIISDGPNALIFGKKNPNPGEDIILVSSHSDIVKAITEVSSELKEDSKVFHGTYDNLGTNAALVYLLLAGNLPDNIYLAFTADEETGRCNGAKEALEVLHGFTEKDPELCVALDVTDEGFDDKILSLEGLSMSMEQQDKVKTAMMATEGDTSTFCVVKASRKDESLFPKSYLTNTTTVFDESAFYKENKQNTISMCIPSDGSMHSNAGLDVKEPAMVGFMLTLQTFLQEYTRTKTPTLNEFKRLEDLRDFKEYLAKQTATITVRHESQYFKNFLDYDYDLDDDDLYPTSLGSLTTESGEDLWDEENMREMADQELYQILGEENFATFEDFQVTAEGYLGIDFSSPDGEAYLRVIWNDFKGEGYEEPDDGDGAGYNEDMEDESVEYPYDDYGL